MEEIDEARYTKKLLGDHNQVFSPVQFKSPLEAGCHQPQDNCMLLTTSPSAPKFQDMVLYIPESLDDFDYKVILNDFMIDPMWSCGLVKPGYENGILYNPIPEVEELRQCSASSNTMEKEHDILSNTLPMEQIFPDNIPQMGADISDVFGHIACKETVNEEQGKKVLKEKDMIDDGNKKDSPTKKSARKRRLVQSGDMFNGLRRKDGKLGVESSPRSTKNKMAKRKTKDTAIWYKGENMMKLKVCEDKPHKYALKLLSKYYIPEELQDGIVHESPRSMKQPLDPVRWKKIFAVLNRKYGRKRVEESHTLIVEVCNQKCRNIRRVMKRLAKV